ncbi:LOW QUALITY PROTEIN: putative uncharacterized protein FLJ13197, partial [Choloepus didactylus]|uniref:LOW QUALITY PROTEIN: putative uncharacterized protein FLJ13197 n=1 Tax=Choloepus didactylus TaxID=27675 RepID=UPI00189CFCFE
GMGTYFENRGAERSRQEIKARLRASVSPANAVMSALQSDQRRRPQGTGMGARATGAVRLGSAAGACVALRLGPGLRAAPFLAPLWLLAPTPGSHMTPAPLALRASRGWRGEDTLKAEVVHLVSMTPGTAVMVSLTRHRG